MVQGLLAGFLDVLGVLFGELLTFVYGNFPFFASSCDAPGAGDFSQDIFLGWGPLVKASQQPRPIILPAPWIAASRSPPNLEPSS